MTGQGTYEKKFSLDLSSHEDNVQETQRDGTARLLEFFQKRVVISKSDQATEQLTHV